ncbi:hypothetical protein [Soonwooa purpurea]
MAEISQSMLKSSSDSEISIFAAKVLNFLNPKFQDEEIELELAEAELYSFARNCELTASEFMIALELAAEGKLSTIPDENGKNQQVKLYREIDRLKLGEVKAAYNYHKKNIDKKYEEGKAMLAKALNPPLEKTPEQISKEHDLWLESEWERVQNDKPTQGAILFYDKIKTLKNVEMIKLKFIENVLENFKPETAIGTIGGIPKMTKNDIGTYFKERLVKSFIQYHDLKKLTKDEWVKYWKT